VNGTRQFYTTLTSCVRAKALLPYYQFVKCVAVSVRVYLNANVYMQPASVTGAANVVSVTQPYLYITNYKTLPISSDPTIVTQGTTWFNQMGVLARPMASQLSLKWKPWVYKTDLGFPSISTNTPVRPVTCPTISSYTTNAPSGPQGIPAYAIPHYGPTMFLYQAISGDPATYNLEYRVTWKLWGQRVPTPPPA